MGFSQSFHRSVGNCRQSGKGPRGGDEKHENRLSTCYGVVCSER